MKPGRNAPCPCGSGKKYKKCCMEKDGSRVVESTEFIWRKLRKTEADLVSMLIEYAGERFEDEASLEAWDEFWLCKEEDDDGDELTDIDSVFGIWFVFNWDACLLLEETGGMPEELGLPAPTIARLYLQGKPESLDAFERRYIDEISSQPYSFYQVIDVDQGQSLIIRDLFLHETHTVIEKQASRPEFKGGIIFTRVLSLDGVSVMVGSFPLMIPSHYQGPLIDYRQDLEKDLGGPMTKEIMLEMDFEFRELFFDVYSNLKKPVLPEIQNTDGEALNPVRLLYHLNCLPEEAFEQLKSFAPGSSDEELLAGADYDKKGALTSIRFPWLKKGDEKHSELTNTVMGNIQIHKNRMIVDVNSFTRADIIRKEIDSRLGKRAVYKKSVISSLQKMMEKGMESEILPKDQEGELTQDELMQLPEVKAKIAEMAKTHWDTWADTPVPALGNMTPRQAAQDPVGREKLDGLFLHYESMTEKQGQNEFSPDIAKLKQILGIKTHER